MGFYGRQRIRKVLTGTNLGIDGLGAAKKARLAMPEARRFAKTGRLKIRARTVDRPT
jgi:hypothetical protein